VFCYSIVATNSFLQGFRVVHPRPGGKSISCLLYCCSSCCLVLLTIAPVDIIFTSSCSRSPRTTAYTFFSANLFINKNDGPFCRFSLLRSSPMVELVQYSIAFTSRYTIHFWTHGGTSLFTPLMDILLTIFAPFFPLLHLIISAQLMMDTRNFVIGLSRKGWHAQHATTTTINLHRSSPPINVLVHQIIWSTLLNMVAKRKADELYVSFRW
jgi:hypothetical protein